jgi:hypothetical protein
MVFNLCSRFPEFPSEEKGDKPVTVRRALLLAVQSEFDRLLASLEPTKEEQMQRDSQEFLHRLQMERAALLANMKFIGHLYLRNLLPIQVMALIAHALLGLKEGAKILPKEHTVECAVKLLEAIGHTLDSSSQGKQLASAVLARLTELKRSDGAGGKPLLSKRVQFQIQDLLELRGRGWVQTVFKEQAQTLADIRKQAARGAALTTQTAGARPAYLAEAAAARVKACRSH